MASKWQSVLILESITGGSINPSDAPPSLWAEGLAMRNALVADALALGCKLVVAVAEGSSSPAGAEPYWIQPAQRWRDWQKAMALVDAVLVVAPETHGELLRLSALAYHSGCQYLGSDLEAVRIAGSKRATARQLQAQAVAVIPTYAWAEFQGLLATQGPQALADEWVVKPDDGVGGSGCRRLGLAALRAAPLVNHAWSLQPWVAGLSCSMSLLVWQGQTHVLARTRQALTWNATDVGLTGLAVNAWDLDWQRAQALAEAVTRALPGLAGFCGVDVLLTEKDELMVVEVNPRVTSSYAALHTSLGMNPLGLLQDLMAGVPIEPDAWRERSRPVALSFASTWSSQA